MSQQQYDSLIKELGHGVTCGSLGGAVGEAIEAKHYGLIQHGAAIFEFFPFYPVETKILDSLFLNNYVRAQQQQQRPACRLDPARICDRQPLSLSRDQHALSTPRVCSP